MPKNLNNPPKLCRRKDNNTAYTTYRGKRIYLGKWGSDKAKAHYNAIVADWTKFNAISSDAIIPSGRNHLCELLLAFLADYRSKPNTDVSTLNAYKLVIKAINTLYPRLKANDFTPNHLERVRDYLANQTFERGGETHRRSRQYLNKLTGYIRSIFAWGVGKSLVDVNTYMALKFVRPLRAGQTVNPESIGREAVSEGDLKAVLDHLQPTYRDIIQLLRITGMRPSEICNLKVGDIDQSGPIWIYNPKKHKNSWRGKDRPIAFGERAQKILNRHLYGRKKTEFVFTPKRIMAERWEIQAQNRKTKRYGVQKHNAENPSPKKFYRFHEKLTSGLLGKKVREACAKAKGINRPWTIYELRHTAISEIRLEEGVVFAQHFAGHSNLSTQDYYDHTALQAVIKLAEKRG